MLFTIQFMRWLEMKLDTEELLRDFLTDISVNYKIDKYHLKMQRKNQFVKVSFYELVLFWSSSANWKLSICIINQNLFATTATISFTMRDSA